MVNHPLLYSNLIISEFVELNWDGYEKSITFASNDHINKIYMFYTKTNLDSYDYSEENKSLSCYWKNTKSVLCNSLIVTEIIPEYLDDLSAYCEMKEYVSHPVFNMYEKKKYTSCGILFIHDLNHVPPEGGRPPRQT
jgi:hypothetical protein